MKIIEIFNIKAKALNLSDLITTIESKVNGSSTSPTLISSINLHALYIYKKNHKFREFYKKAQYCYIDGMPVIWMLKLLDYSIYSSYRITVLDWNHEFLKLANRKKMTVGLFGGASNVAKGASDLLNQQFQQINFIHHHGYVDNDEIPIDFINNDIDVLLIGMGMPKEEVWILNNSHKLRAKVVIPVGGYLDYIVGKTYTPPRWSGRLGLEWLFRLISSPRRLSYRYLIEPWPVLFRFIGELRKTKNTT